MLLAGSLTCHSRILAIRSLSSVVFEEDLAKSEIINARSGLVWIGQDITIDPPVTLAVYASLPQVKSLHPGGDCLPLSNLV